MALEAEIITIGDEIMTGHTVDTNSAWLAAELIGVGVPVTYQTSVGDDIEIMEAVIRQALKRAQIVITTGGLGPTDDDLTKRAIVKVFKRNLIFHEEILEDIKARYAARGIVMPAMNQNQALLPQGAKFFPNTYGSAVGICIAERNEHFIALPGVPLEMKQIVTDSVLPYLRGLQQDQAIAVIKLRTTGIIESRLAEIITPVLKLDSDTKLGYLPNFTGVDLRVIATSPTQAEADRRASAVISHIEQVAGKYVYGRDNDTLESVVGGILRTRKLSLAVAESCTGGELGMAITSIAGSSEYFLGGVQAYSNDVKSKLLSVSPDILNTHGAVSEQCATAMALGVKQLLKSDYALSVTGIAGPDGGTADKPVGTTWIGIATPAKSFARKFQFGKERRTNRSRAVYAALELLRRDLLEIV